MNIPGFKNERLPIPRFLLANAILSLGIAVIFVSGARESWMSFARGFVWSFVISVTIWTGSILLNHWLDRKIKWADQPVLRSISGIIILVIYSVVAFIGAKYMLYLVFYGKLPSDSWDFTLGSSILTVLISLYFSLIFTAIGFFRAWKKETVNSEKLKSEMMVYKYESLRNQINPHFLFNSLNVLSDLVYDDQAMAVKFIRQMSDLFRYVLDSRDKELVPLKDELAFIDSFTFMLKTRFEEKLIIDIDVQANAEDYIVPMTLQLLIENAVKHNEVSEAFPLKISVKKVADCLEVENNLKTKSAGDNSTKTGLKNLTQQFAFFSDVPIKIIFSDERYMVRVPILKSVGK